MLKNSLILSFLLLVSLTSLGQVKQYKINGASAPALKYAYLYISGFETIKSIMYKTPISNGKFAFDIKTDMEELPYRWGYLFFSNTDNLSTLETGLPTDNATEYEIFHRQNLNFLLDDFNVSVDSVSIRNSVIQGSKINRDYDDLAKICREDVSDGFAEKFIKSHPGSPLALGAILLLIKPDSDSRDKDKARKLLEALPDDIRFNKMAESIRKNLEI